MNERTDGRTDGRTNERQRKRSFLPRLRLVVRVACSLKTGPRNVVEKLLVWYVVVIGVVEGIGGDFENVKRRENVEWWTVR